MNDSIIRRVILLGAIAIIGILVIQSYWVYNTWNLKEDEFHQTVKIALIEAAKNLAAQDGVALPIQDMIRRRSSNYYVVNINNRIYSPVLEYYLIKAFEDHALEVEFEYAIFDCSNDRMVYGSYCDLTDKEAKPPQADIGKLPTMEGLTYYFGIKFLNRESYLLGQMRLALFFTALLLLSIFFFAYAILVILRQKRLSEMQKDFIDNMTHEFKTPISTIKISAEVLKNSEELKDNDRLQRYTGILQEQNQRLNDQVEKVLNIARVERKSFELQKEAIQINDLLKSIIASTVLKVQQQKGQLESNLIPSLPIIKADKHHLTNVLHNLLDNAIKYSKEAPQITVTTQIQDKVILLSVADKGIGIDRSLHKKVFKKFYRVPTGNVHNVKGFGLGLFYIKNICKAHGWSIYLESAQDEGTKVTISIPTERNTIISKKWWKNLFGKKTNSPVSIHNPQPLTRN